MQHFKTDIYTPSRFPSFSRWVMLLCVLFCVGTMPADAKGGNKKKKKVETVNLEIDPDPVCKRARPDSHPRPLEMPGLFYLGGGKQGLEGIDISHYQGKIDWAAVATDSHANFVYLKASEGIDLADNTYQYNIAEAHQHGIKVGSYHFFRAQASAKSQFENFKRAFDPSKQDLLPVVDVEVMPKGMSKSAFDDCLSDLLTMMEHEYRRKPVIYTGLNFYNRHFHGSRFAGRYKFWIAAYAPTSAPSLDGGDDYLVWQYSAKGKIRGVRGYVDLNRFVGRHVLNEIRY